jgi:tetratricopeptide (TPR) repeat protein
MGMFNKSSKSQVILLMGLIFLGVFLTYSNHFHNSFHFDDSHTIQNNTWIRDLKNIPRFFKDGTTFSSLPTNQSYRPLVTTTLAIDYALGGKLDPFWFHISTFILFLVQGIFMYLFFRVIFDIAYPLKSNYLSALFAMAWYLIHPANAETINYIISRSDTLSTLFVVIAFAMYAKSAFCRTTFLYLIPVLIGALAKPTAVMFGPLLFVYILFFEEDAGLEGLLSVFFRVLKKASPALICSVLLYFFLKKMDPPTFTPGGASTFHYIITQPYVTLRYFITFFLPFDLSADTDWGPFASMANVKCLTGFAFVGFLVYISFVLSANKRYRPIAFGLIWFLLALLPTALIPLSEVMNDHRIFFPYVGLVISAVWTIVLILGERLENIQLRSVQGILIVTCATVAIGAYAYGTRQRNKVWRTEERLWYDVVTKSPNNGRGQMNYGLNLMSRGDFAGAEDRFKRGLELWPYYGYLYINMGVLKDFMGKPEEAETYLKNGILYASNNPEAYYYYARFLKMHKRYPEALQNMAQLMRLSPNHMNGQYLLLEIYAETEDFERLKLMANQILLINPGDAQALKYLQFAQSRRSNLDQLVIDASNQPSPEKYLDLSLAYYQAEKYEQCISAAKEALKLKADYPEAWNNIAAANGQLKNWEEEIKACQEALRLRPGFEIAKNNLAYAQSMLKK